MGIFEGTTILPSFDDLPHLEPLGPSRYMPFGYITVHPYSPWSYERSFTYTIPEIEASTTLVFPDPTTGKLWHNTMRNRVVVKNWTERGGIVGQHYYWVNMDDFSLVKSR